MAIKVRWSPIAGADISSYKIYRSMIGFATPSEAPFGLVAGETLMLKVNNQTVQMLTFPGDLAIIDLVDFINDNLTGAKAFKALNDDSLFVRSDIRMAPGFIEIVGGTAAPKLGQSNRVISEKSECLFVENVAFPGTEYCDEDGVLEDFYALSTVDSLDNESDKSGLRQAISFSGPVCVIEGRTVDLQGRSICDVKVTARLIVPPDVVGSHATILTSEVSTLTGEDGRFSLPVLQGAHIIFEINDTKVSDPILIPEQSYAFFDELTIDETYRFVDFEIQSP